MQTAQMIEYIRTLQKAEAEFKGLSTPQLQAKTGRMQQLGFILFCLIDTLRLLLLKSRLRHRPWVYTAPNFFQETNGQLCDRITGAVLSASVVYINHSKTQRIKLDGVFHIGGVALLLARLFFRKYEPSIRYFLAYRFLNNLLLKNHRGQVFTLCFYDMNGLSLVFSTHRSQFNLCEIQHGNMINYPPYAIPAPVKIADCFYVRNARTTDYLRNHLCRHFESVYHHIPYPKVKRTEQAGLHIFYASTVEFVGFHPVFQAFMNQTAPENYTLTVRLHPREKGQETLFSNNPWKKDLYFDHSFNWLENLKISNTLVISPWSSCIEEAIDNQLTTIIIDPVGRTRYRHLIEEKTCFYSDDLTQLIPLICQPPNP